MVSVMPLIAVMGLSGMKCVKLYKGIKCAYILAGLGLTGPECYHNSFESA